MSEELKALAKEYDDAPDDAEWEPPHPIFRMAESIDNLTTQRDELLKALKMAQSAINNGVGGMIAGSLMQTHIDEVIAKVEG